MAHKLNEICICKSVSVKLNDDKIMLLAYVLHTANKEDRHAGRDKSIYRYEGRIISKSELEQLITVYKSNEHSAEPWLWETDIPSWDKNWIMSVNQNMSKKGAAKWYATRLRKPMSWDEFMSLATEGKKKTSLGERTTNARYELTGYTLADGTQFDITSAEQMLALGDVYFSKSLTLKRDLPKTK